MFNRVAYFQHCRRSQTAATVRIRFQTRLIVQRPPFGGFAQKVADWRANPLLVRRGACGIKKISAKPTLEPQSGWSLTNHVSKCILQTCAVSDHPVRSSNEASRHLLDVASTPPPQEGNESAETLRHTQPPLPL